MYMGLRLVQAGFRIFKLIKFIGVEFIGFIVYKFRK